MVTLDQLTGTMSFPKRPTVHDAYCTISKKEEVVSCADRLAKESDNIALLLETPLPLEARVTQRHRIYLLYCIVDVN